MTKRVFPIGVDNFAELVANEDYYFCDKTLMIKELIDRKEKVTLIMRPRRFGKTLNMSMLKYFFAAKIRDIRTESLFVDLKIAQADGGKYLQYQGESPVIFISLKDVNANSFDEALDKIQILIQEVYREYRDLFDSSILAEDEKELFELYLQGKLNKSQLEQSLKTLSQLLYKHYGQQVYILIDEYDSPLNNVNAQYFDAMTKFMRNFFSATFKTNDALAQGVLTGVLRISKDSMLSGLNNLVVYTVLDSGYKEYFGFTEDEVIALFESWKAEGLKQYDDNKLMQMREWYNGYQIGGIVIYNPWSIVNYLKNNCVPDVYWVRTGQADLIKTAIIKSDLALQQKLELLLQKKTITVDIDTKVIFDRIDENEMVFWGLLLFAGYLRVESSALSPTGFFYRCNLSIPNAEIMRVFNTYVAEWMGTEIGKRYYQPFLEHLVAGNVDQLHEDLSDYLLKSASYFDVGNKVKSEQFYHGFVLALIAGLAATHRVLSNRESGLGRYDVMLIPNDSKNSQGIIIELKYAQMKDNVKNDAQLALQQIETKKYAAELETYAYIQQVLQIGIAFSGREVAIVSRIIDLYTRDC